MNGTNYYVPDGSGDAERADGDPLVDGTPFGLARIPGRWGRRRTGSVVVAATCLGRRRARRRPSADA